MIISHDKNLPQFFTHTGFVSEDAHLLSSMTLGNSTCLLKYRGFSNFSSSKWIYYDELHHGRIQVILMGHFTYRNVTHRLSFSFLSVSVDSVHVFYISR